MHPAQLHVVCHLPGAGKAAYEKIPSHAGGSMGIFLRNDFYPSIRIWRTVASTMVCYADTGNSFGNLCNHIRHFFRISFQYVRIKNRESCRGKLLYLCSAGNCGIHCLFS